MLGPRAVGKLRGGHGGKGNPYINQVPGEDSMHQEAYAELGHWRASQQVSGPGNSGFCITLQISEWEPKISSRP
jgi:hypothetical protein